jgi:hypothetical protein
VFAQLVHCIGDEPRRAHLRLRPSGRSRQVFRQDGHVCQGIWVHANGPHELARRPSGTGLVDCVSRATASRSYVHHERAATSN